MPNDFESYHPDTCASSTYTYALPQEHIDLVKQDFPLVFKGTPPCIAALMHFPLYIRQQYEPLHSSAKAKLFAVLQTCSGHPWGLCSLQL